ncbi:MAG: hypothetical protein HYS09_06845, partial [Chloroflexi bacterium]|nr:hypothetical protein [Chloroflexota bacterium]
AVTSAKIADATITSADIAAGGISDSADFAAGVVDTAALAADAVTSAKIADATITSADIAAGGISDSADFTAGVVDSAALADTISLPTSLTVGATGTAVTVMRTGTFTSPAGAGTTVIVNDADATTAAVVSASCNADTAAGWRIIADGVDDAGDADAIVDFQVVFLADPTDSVDCDYLLVKP